MSMNSDNETKKWAAKQFGISEDEVLWYNSGSCYDRIGVTTQQAADKVSAKVKGETANGGMLDGMPLGGQTEYNRNGNHYFDVTC